MSKIEDFNSVLTQSKVSGKKTHIQKPENQNVELQFDDKLKLEISKAKQLDENLNQVIGQNKASSNIPNLNDSVKQVGQLIEEMNSIIENTLNNDTKIKKTSQQQVLSTYNKQKNQGGS